MVKPLQFLIGRGELRVPAGPFVAIQTTTSFELLLAKLPLPVQLQTRDGDLLLAKLPI